MSPLEQLQALNTQVENATDLEELRPIFERMTAISHDHPDDFEVVLAVDQVRRHIVDKGKLLREQQEPAEPLEYEGAEYEVDGEPPPEPAGPVDNFDGFTGLITTPTPAASDETRTFSPSSASQTTGTGSFQTPPPGPTINAPVPPPPPIPPVPAQGVTPRAPVPPKPVSPKGGSRTLAMIGGAVGLLVLLAEAHSGSSKRTVAEARKTLQ